MQQFSIFNIEEHAWHAWIGAHTGPQVNNWCTSHVHLHLCKLFLKSWTHHFLTIRLCCFHLDLNSWLLLLLDMWIFISDSQTGDCCDNYSMTPTALPGPTSDISCLSARQRSVWDGTKGMRHCSHVKPEKWVSWLSGMWVQVHALSHLLWCGHRIMSFCQPASPCEVQPCQQVRV